MPHISSFILSCFLFINLSAHAGPAVKSGIDTSKHKKGVIRVIADTQLVHDIKPVIPGDEGPQMTGYRIQVYAGTERETAQKLKNEIAINYGVRTYMIYESPYFKIRIGDFRSRMEAQQMFHTLKQKYTGILLVPGPVNLPDLKQ